MPTAVDRTLAERISRLAYANPFLPERVDCEREILGAEVAEGRDFWHADQGAEHVEAIQEQVDPLVTQIRRRLRKASRRPPNEEMRLYRDVFFYWLYNRYEAELFHLIERPDHGTRKVGFFRRFAADFEVASDLAGDFEAETSAAHIFAFFFQVRRAFHLIFRQIHGGSMPAAKLRAALWQSVFTHDMRRYRRSLYARMGDVTTLITGPSGTGKELAARAIGFARYIPFDETKGAFAEDFESSFYALNLSALSPTLIESELFGHRRGAFTGAIEDRAGWLETCPPLGTIFLDEIGEVSPAIQVKLLRVLETRTFQRLGDTKDLPFRGKVVAATHRDFAAAMASGDIREDFYYRLCSDHVRTPSLRERLDASPAELDTLAEILAARVAGEEEAREIARESVRWIRTELGRHYPWPGNIRELGQCVRSVMIRGRYEPPRTGAPADGGDLDATLANADLPLSEVERRYIEAVYRRTGSYQAASHTLGIDRRTVKAKLLAARSEREG